MDRRLASGYLLTAAGIGGYAAGIAVPYPGRAFSLTLVMVGLTVAIIGRSGEGATV